MSMFVKLSETSGEELGILNKLVVGVLLLLVGSLSVFESSKDGESKFSLRTVAVRSQHGGNDSSVGKQIGNIPFEI